MATEYRGALPATDAFVASLINNSNSGTTTALRANYARLGVDNIVIGNGAMANPVNQTDTALTAASSINNPHLPFAGAFSAFAYFTGAEQAGAGSLQGGASEAYVALNGTVTQAVLGFEGIGVVVGNTGGTGPQGTYPNVIGLQGTAQVSGDVSATTLTAILARAPFSNSGAPTVGTAYAIRAQEPTVGTQRYTYYGTGRHTFALGVDANIIEILGNSLVKRWAVDGNGMWTGYATDGSSTRVFIDPSDTPTAGRFISNIFSGSTKHISFLYTGTEVFSVDNLGILSLSTSGTTGIKTVQVGAADSGGTGYRMLRVTN